MSAADTRAAAAPSSMASTLVFARLALTRMRRGRVIYFTLALLLLPALVALIAVLRGSWGGALFRQIVTVYTDFLLMFVPAIHAAPALGEEIDARTFTYVFARPVPRWSLPLGKYLATALVLVTGCAASVVITYLVAMIREPGDIFVDVGILGDALVAAILGAIAFGAVATTVGALFARRPVVATLLYLLIVEGLFGHIPGFLKAIALSFHLRVVAGLHQASARWEPNPSAALSIIVLLGVSVLLLFLASFIVSSAEYRTDK